MGYVSCVCVSSAACWYRNGVSLCVGHTGGVWYRPRVRYLPPSLPPTAEILPLRSSRARGISVSTAAIRANAWAGTPRGSGDAGDVRKRERFLGRAIRRSLLRTSRWSGYTGAIVKRGSRFWDIVRGRVTIALIERRRRGD